MNVINWKPSQVKWSLSKSNETPQWIKSKPPKSYPTQSNATKPNQIESSKSTQPKTMQSMKQYKQFPSKAIPYNPKWWVTSNPIHMICFVERVYCLHAWLDVFDGFVWFVWNDWCDVFACVAWLIGLVWLNALTAWVGSIALATLGWHHWVYWIWLHCVGLLRLD